MKETKMAVADKIVAEEIEVRKTVRKAALGFYDDNYYTYDVEAALEKRTETKQAA